MMNKILHVTLAVFCLAVLAFALTGCGGGGNGGPPAQEDSNAQYSPNTAPSVAQFDGSWWYRETPATGISLDIFSFEGREIVFYDENGNEIMRGAATGDRDGAFIMSLEFFGDEECRFDQGDQGWTITMPGSGTVFRQGEAIDRLKVAGEYAGKWFKNGDLGGEYIFINANGSYAIYARVGGEDIVKEEGNWQLKETKSSNDHGRTGYQSISLDGSFCSHDLRITEDKTALWINDLGDYDYYLKESLIGSPEGERALRTVSLYCAPYWRPEAQETGSTYLTFYDDGYLMILTLRGDGRIEETGGGSWKRTGDKFSLTLADGKEQTFAVSGDTLTLADGRTFGRKS